MQDRFIRVSGSGVFQHRVDPAQGHRCVLSFDLELLNVLEHSHGVHTGLDLECQRLPADPFVMNPNCVLQLLRPCHGESYPVTHRQARLSPQSLDSAYDFASQSLSQ